MDNSIIRLVLKSLKMIGLGCKNRCAALAAVALLFLNARIAMAAVDDQGNVIDTSMDKIWMPPELEKADKWERDKQR